MLDKTKIYIIDFEDSFTFNIASELYFFEKSIVVISHKKFFENDFFTPFIDNIENHIAVILGPGPGNPNEYQMYFGKIEKMKNHSLLFIMGVCLGHQVLAMIDGLDIRPSQNPMHGRQVEVLFKNKKIIVQRYNSLAVYFSETGREEVQIRRWDRGVSYQFHPESVGTEENELFFKDLLTFVH